jgi:hypothetical protein
MQSAPHEKKRDDEKIENPSKFWGRKEMVVKILWGKVPNEEDFGFLALTTQHTYARYNEQ